MRFALIVVILAALAPVAAADGASEIRSTHAAALGGELLVAIPAGNAFTAQRPDAPTTFTLEGVSGDAMLYEWRVTSTADVHTQMEPTREVPVRFENASIRGSLAKDAAFSATVLGGEGSVVEVRGDAPASSVRPSWVEAPRWVTNEPPVDSPLLAPWLPLRLVAGDAAVGRLATEVHDPLPQAPRLLLAGPLQLELNGGVLVIEQENGSVSTLTLDPVTHGGTGPVRVTQLSRLILTGTIGAGSIPLEDYWIATGPRAEWHVDGSADWPKASGTHAGTTFADVPVRVEGTFVLAPDAAHAGLLSADRFTVAGAYTLAVGGQMLAPAEAPAPTRASAAWTLAGALAAVLAWFGSPHLAGRLVAPLYTRIARDDIAAHPARSRICALLRENPGLHLRDLHRRVGGAWGTFSFHLGMLRQAGAVRFERDGRYVAAYLAHQAHAPPAPRTPTAQRVLDALPLDGSAMSVTLLRERTGLSRQLLDHHLAALLQQGLVLIEDARPRRVARRLPDARPPHAAPQAA
ncbi:MAG TPA: helix-turn-helix transcriptional regulator [Candidatus Thermoplasmatota archaeon]|nr:helix-turn-helix transcriptional regulator [Candidatus Thermoplasmatota archaeon]